MDQSLERRQSNNYDGYNATITVYPWLANSLGWIIEMLYDEDYKKHEYDNIRNSKYLKILWLYRGYNFL